MNLTWLMESLVCHVAFLYHQRHELTNDNLYLYANLYIDMLKIKYKLLNIHETFKNDTELKQNIYSKFNNGIVP